jgi:hypothetical protein
MMIMRQPHSDAGWLHEMEVTDALFPYRNRRHEKTEGEIWLIGYKKVFEPYKCLKLVKILCFFKYLSPAFTVIFAAFKNGHGKTRRKSAYSLVIIKKTI